MQYVIVKIMVLQICLIVSIKYFLLWPLNNYFTLPDSDILQVVIHGWNIFNWNLDIFFRIWQCHQTIVEVIKKDVFRLVTSVGQRKSSQTGKKKKKLNWADTIIGPCSMPNTWNIIQLLKLFIVANLNISTRLIKPQ